MKLVNSGMGRRIHVSTSQYRCCNIFTVLTSYPWPCGRRFHCPSAGMFFANKSRLRQRPLLKTRNRLNHGCPTAPAAIEDKLFRVAPRIFLGVYMRRKLFGNNGKIKQPSGYFSQIAHLFRDTSFPSLKRLPPFQQLPLQLECQPLALFFHKRSSLGPQSLQKPRQLYLNGRWPIPSRCVLHSEGWGRNGGDLARHDSPLEAKSFPRESKARPKTRLGVSCSIEASFPEELILQMRVLKRSWTS